MGREADGITRRDLEIARMIQNGHFEWLARRRRGNYTKWYVFCIVRRAVCAALFEGRSPAAAR